VPASRWFLLNPVGKTSSSSSSVKTSVQASKKKSVQVCSFQTWDGGTSELTIAVQ
jgi:hypothetical protein